MISRVIGFGFLIVGLASCSDVRKPDEGKLSELKEFSVFYYENIHGDFESMKPYLHEDFFFYQTEEELQGFISNHKNKVGSYKGIIIDTIISQKEGYLAPFYSYMIVSEVKYLKGVTHDTLRIKEEQEGVYEVYGWYIEWK